MKRGAIATLPILTSIRSGYEQKSHEASRNVFLKPKSNREEKIISSNPRTNTIGIRQNLIKVFPTGGNRNKLMIKKTNNTRRIMPIFSNFFDLLRISSFSKDLANLLRKIRKYTNEIIRKNPEI